MFYLKLHCIVLSTSFVPLLRQWQNVYCNDIYKELSYFLISITLHVWEVLEAF